MEEKRVLKSDDLDYLQDLPLFKKKVALKIKLEDYVIEESYQEISLDKDDNNIVKIKEDKCVSNKITSFKIKVDSSDSSIISYVGDGPAVFSYVKPYTNSTKYIINREAKSIGYKISTGDIMNTTKVCDHIIYGKTNNELLYVMKEFFKGGEKDDNPVLNTLYNTTFIYDNEEKTFYKEAKDQVTLFDKDGNIEDFTIANSKYADTIYGETICIDTKYKYMSSDDDKQNIIPKLTIDGDEVDIKYIRKAEPFKTLSEEKFKVNEDNKLELVYSSSQFGEVTLENKDNIAYYVAICEAEKEKYIINGRTNFPLSGEIFTINTYKGIDFPSMNQYFANIYQTRYFGQTFLTESYVDSVEVEGRGKYVYEYDEYNQIKSQKWVSENTEKEFGSYQKSALPNGNIIIESVISAEPVYPFNSDSIFYRAIEITKNNNITMIVSDYRASIIKFKDYK